MAGGGQRSPSPPWKERTPPPSWRDKSLQRESHHLSTKWREDGLFPLWENETPSSGIPSLLNFADRPMQRHRSRSPVGKNNIPPGRNIDVPDRSRGMYRSDREENQMDNKFSLNKVKREPNDYFENSGRIREPETHFSDYGNSVTNVKREPGFYNDYGNRGRFPYVKGDPDSHHRNRFDDDRVMKNESFYTESQGTERHVQVENSMQSYQASADDSGQNQSEYNKKRVRPSAKARRARRFRAMAAEDENLPLEDLRVTLDKTKGTLPTSNDLVYHDDHRAYYDGQYLQRDDFGIPMHSGNEFAEMPLMDRREGPDFYEKGRFSNEIFPGESLSISFPNVGRKDFPYDQFPGENYRNEEISRPRGIMDFEQEYVHGNPLSGNEELFECQMPGCLVRTDSLKLHTLRKHIAEIMWSVEESDKQCQKKIAPQRASLLRALAKAILGPQATLSQLVDLVNGIGVPFTQKDELTCSHWAMVEVCRHQNWPVPDEFSLNPINSPAVMIHWRVQALLMGLLSEERCKSFLSVYRLSDQNESAIATRILNAVP